METEPSRPADGKRSERREQPLSAGGDKPPTGSSPSPLQQQPPPSNPRSVHGALGRLHHRQPKRSDLLLRLQHQHKAPTAGLLHSTDTPGTSGGRSSISSLSVPSSSTQGYNTQGVLSHSSQEAPECSLSKRGDRKPQKPGKYVCTYCGRPCAKPSVLKKHIRSHTGERPYPCPPCGFSFKTKSNLYKHRKSHAHRIKAGLMSSREELSLSGPEGGAPGEDPEEPTEGESTDSEEETGDDGKDRLGKQKSNINVESSGPFEGARSDDSQAVKQRLAMRLSERNRAPVATTDYPPSSSTSSSSLGPGSKGSQESGYFSSSGSAEMSRADSQVSPPTANAKSYAEIILGKYGRLGGQQRGFNQHHAHSSSSGVEEKTNMPFSVPKTQVIEHITNLITINEAVVDTSEIDSVKPRRSSLSRKSSNESPKFSSPRDPYVFEPMGDSPGTSSMSSKSFCPHAHNADPSVVQQSSSPLSLLRSHSMPASASQGDPSTSNSTTSSPREVRRLSQSFDEQQAVVAEMRVAGQHRMLRRQPAIEVPLGSELLGAIEVPLGSELVPEEAGSSSTATEIDVSRKQQQQRKGTKLYESEDCSAFSMHRPTYEAHSGHTGQPIEEQERDEVGGACKEGRPQMMQYKFQALAMAVRKRRKEESLEEDPPSPGPVAVMTCSPTAVPPCLEEESRAFWVDLPQSELQQQDRKGISVIQHTSSFEKQECKSKENQDCRVFQECKQTPQPKSSPSISRLVRQHNIQVPEILVTVEPDTDMMSASPPAFSSKEPERVVEGFQWPQRSQSMAQLPAEKLPPKKKRLRLTECPALSSGESSFESISMCPRSPSQESNISHTSSHSASEDTGRKPAESSLRGSGSPQVSHMLTVPSGHHRHNQSQREMRRSASEQAPASPQQTVPVEETRSKSFDYGSLSPQQSVSAWRERRKCLLVKHATLGEPDHEEGYTASQPETLKAGPSYTSHLALHLGEASTSTLSPEAPGKTLQMFHHQIVPLRPANLDQFSPVPLLPVTTAISDTLSTHIFHRTLLQTHHSTSHIHAHAGHVHPFSTLLPLQYPTRAGQAVYLPVSPGLTIQVPSQPLVLSGPFPHGLAQLPSHQQRPIIATCLAQLTPATSLVVPVRLQTSMPTYASALYTTLSGILESARSQGPICCTAMIIMGQLEQDKLQRSYLKIPTPDFKSYLPLTLPLPLELGCGSTEAYGGAGGSKRMLSPAASLELSTEAQRQLKRIKEEEYKEEKVGEEEEHQGIERELEGGVEKELGVVSVKVEEEVDEGQDLEKPQDKREGQGEAEPKIQENTEVDEAQGVRAPRLPQCSEQAGAPSYPTLHTATSVSWCYLNYVKPNPSPQREPQTSVYSSWSVSVHNPNLPGLSTKLSLSLLRSKQKHSSETYTMATAPNPGMGKEVPASCQKPCVSEIHATPSSSPVKVKESPQKPEKEDKNGRKEEQGPTSKQSEPPCVRIFEGGYKSNEEYVYVRGRGRGKYVCGECGIRCKKPSMLRKHARTHTDIRPYVCKHCNFAFKTKGNLTKHMKSKAHGKKCQQMGTSGSSVDEPETEEAGGSEVLTCGSEDQGEHQVSDVDDSEDDDDNEEEEESSYDEQHDELPSSSSSDTHPSTRERCSSKTKPMTSDVSTLKPQPSSASIPSPSQEPTTSLRLWASRRAASPGSRRMLFSRQCWDTSPKPSFSPSSDSCSPIQSFSPRLELASTSRHFSPEKGASPISALNPLSSTRPLSPLRTLSPNRHRTLQVPVSPPVSPLRVQHRPSCSPACIPGDIYSMITSERRQELFGTPSQWLRCPEPTLSFPPTFSLSPSDRPAHSTAQSQSMDHIFSHLPLHSQQARLPYLMIPIGGIQMVQARPLSQLATPTSTFFSSQTEGLLPLGHATREPPRDETLKNQGLRTHVEHQSDFQEGACQSILCFPSVTPDSPSQPGSAEPTPTDTKQYGSLQGSSCTQKSEAESIERPAGRPPCQPVPSPTQRIGQLAEQEESSGLCSRSTGLEVVKGDSADQDQSI
ncbi:hypothetical protein DPEC_G00354320 [Dallia pectoralis]|uniref:Uncharacterized protein n=1 Tax=Dallia pectoralis TaxID=75939 RepID=A0ACC2F2N9_DALPE|nr:hypothetical protein DPEC_G00354320 [Dallia pectoralis]